MTNKSFGILAMMAFWVLPASAQLTMGELELRDGVYYAPGTTQPYSGLVSGDNGPHGEIKEGLRTGLWAYFNASGVKEMEVTFAAGEVQLMVGFHPDGRRASEVPHVNGRRNGVGKSWDGSGVLRAERPWKDNQLHGVERVFDANGQLIVATTYEMGTKHGATTWYYADGSVKWETAFAAGERTGNWKQYGANGRVSMESVWEAGELVRRVDPHAGH